MRKIMGLIAVALVLSRVTANAGETSRRARAEELLNAMNMPESVEQAHATWCRQLAPKLISTQIAKTRQEAGQTNTMSDVLRHTERIMDLMAHELSWDKVKDDYITLYAETFTEEELKGMLAFYRSAAGRALVRKQPELMKRTMDLTVKASTRMMLKLQDMVQEIKE